MDTTQSATPRRETYSQVFQQQVFPTKDQAIVLDAIEGVQIQEYAEQLSKIIDSKNIRFASRISNGRVCIYLNSKETADKLTETSTKINIGSHTLEIRPLISKSKRIILSNVCPIIPHTVLLQELQKMDIIPTSQMLFVRAGMSPPGLSHQDCPMIP